MTRKALDPNLASILDSIRATVGGEPAPQPAPAVELVDPEPEVAAAPEPDPAKPAKGSRKAAAAPVPHQPVAAAFAPAPAGSPGSRTVEEFLAELIRPQLDAWLKANLPELIQKMAADEIARLTGRR
jgi:cell pole-organizing protein PopZ